MAKVEEKIEEKVNVKVEVQKYSKEQILLSKAYANRKDILNVILEDKEKMIRIAEKYIEKYQADAMLLGCTEIPLLISQKDCAIPIFDTTRLHGA